MKKMLLTVGLLATLKLWGISFYAWEDSYQFWLPPTMKDEIWEFSQKQTYPFDAPEEVFDPAVYQVELPVVGIGDTLLGKLNYFEAPILPQADSLRLVVGQQSFSIPLDKQLGELNFPLEGVLQVDDKANMYVFWRVYRPLGDVLDIWLKQQIQNALGSQSLEQGTYSVKIYIP